MNAAVVAANIYLVLVEVVRIDVGNLALVDNRSEGGIRDAVVSDP